MPAARPGSFRASPGDPALAAAFAPFQGRRKILLAVSGGPDSTALMLLASTWRASCPEAPELAVATVDHGLRPEAREEAEAVGSLARSLGLAHTVLELPTCLPSSRLQEAARNARYVALLAHAHAIDADVIATAHTRDDQAETVLFRLMRGSGLSGLSAIPLVRELGGIMLMRPLLGWEKSELVAACAAAGVDFVRDPSNADPRFARARLRALMPVLAREGLDAARLSRLASRMERADAALEAFVDAAMPGLWSANENGVTLDRQALGALPEEVGIRILGRAVEQVGDGPVELAKLEALHVWLNALPEGAGGGRTLAGAMIHARRSTVLIRRAPPRRMVKG